MTSKTGSNKVGQKKSTRGSPLTFAYAIRSFVGYLEGTEKAEHTIKNYRLDLLAFEKYLQSVVGGGGKKTGPRLEALTRDDLEHYHSYLKTSGFKVNTRRRKLLTVRRFLEYLTRRNKLPMDVGRSLPTPHKVERIPFTVDSRLLLERIQGLPAETLLDTRNQVLLWMLAETGALVSEVSRLRFEQCHEKRNETPSQISFLGKSARIVPVSPELVEAVRELQRRGGGDNSWLFLGFNKFGSLGAPITSRGVELLVRAFAGRLGFPELTPRTFRHSAVLRWHEEGLSQQQIQERLGLKTAYAFRSYQPLFKSKC